MDVRFIKETFLTYEEWRLVDVKDDGIVHAFGTSELGKSEQDASKVAAERGWWIY